MWADALRAWAKTIGWGGVTGSENSDRGADAVGGAGGQGPVIVATPALVADVQGVATFAYGR